jgi:hypothetical protein
MGKPPVRGFFLATCAWALAGTLANGQEAVGTAAHVRGTHVEEALLLDELVARSLIARDLMDRLDRSDLTIYINYKWFSSPTLHGRIGFPGAASHVRLLVIELDCRQNRTDQLAALAHELQHAVEIADAPLVSDARSLAALYTSIGSMTGYSAGAETFETDAAAETGRRVRSELANPSAAVDAGVRH